MRTNTLFAAYVIGLFALLFGLLIFTTSNAHAQSTIAVVNIQKIMQDSKAAKAIRSQVKSKQKSFQAELDSKEDALQKEDQELAKQRSVLSQEAFEKKYRAFRKKAADAQKEVRAKRSKLDQGFNKALASVQQKVGEIVATICKEKGADVAISASQALYANPALDITDEVLKRLDSQMPNVSVSF